VKQQKLFDEKSSEVKKLECLCNSHEKKSADLDKEINILTDKLNECQDELGTAKNELQNARIDAAKYQSIEDEMQQSLKIRDDQIDELQKQIVVSENMIDDLKSQNIKFDAEKNEKLGFLESQYTKEKGKREACEVKIARLEADNEKMSEELVVIKMQQLTVRTRDDEISQLEKKIADAEVEINNSKAEQVKQQKLFDEKSSEVKKLECLCNSHEKKSADLDKEINILTDKLNECQDELGTAKNELQNARIDAAKYQSIEDEMQQSLKIRDDQIDELQKQIVVSENMIDDLKSQNIKFDAEKNEKLGFLESQYTKEKGKREACEVKIARLEADNEKMSEELVEIKMQHLKAVRRIDNMAEKHEEEKQKTQTEFKKLHDTLYNRDTTIYELRDKLNNAEDTITFMQTELEQHRNEADILKSDKQDLEQGLLIKINENDLLNENIDDLNEKLDTAEAQLAEALEGFMNFQLSSNTCSDSSSLLDKMTDGVENVKHEFDNPISPVVKLVKSLLLVLGGENMKENHDQCVSEAWKWLGRMKNIVEVQDDNIEEVDVSISKKSKVNDSLLSDVSEVVQRKEISATESNTSILSPPKIVKKEWEECFEEIPNIVEQSSFEDWENNEFVTEINMMILNAESKLQSEVGEIIGDMNLNFNSLFNDDADEIKEVTTQSFSLPRCGNCEALVSERDNLMKDMLDLIDRSKQNWEHQTFAI